MATYSIKRAAKQRIIRQTKKQRANTSWKEVEIIDTDSRPSWKRYAAPGVSSLRVSAGIDADGVAVLEITASETALADPLMDQKRDVSKQVFVSAFGPAAFEIYELLREAFEPKVAPR